jgi:prophage antirepressor-like protein
MIPQTALQTFDFNSNPVRALERDGQPWFVAADVCRVLELENPTEALRPLDADEKNTLSNSEGIHSGAGNPNVRVINESGLYALIFKSRKPQAKAFRKWVTAEVLPQIRKTGAYLTTALDFEKYPVAKEFSDIFHWLRHLSVDPNEAAGVARALLQSSLRERRREMSYSPQPSEDQQAVRDMQRLVEIVVSYMEGSSERVLELYDAIQLAKKHRIFLWLFSTADSPRISQTTRLRFGIMLSRFHGRHFQIGAESFSFSRHGSKNVRRYVIARQSMVTAS